MTDIVQRLRATTPESGWAVVNLKTGGIVIWFRNQCEFSSERKARDWLQEHAATHRSHEVRHYQDACLDHDAADEIDRLRRDAERYRWLRDHATIATPHIATLDGWKHYESGADEVVDAAMAASAAVGAA